MKSKAIQILNDNWRDGYSVPSKNLYPYQWLWDSGFIAIGFAHYDMDKAEKEIETLIRCSMGKRIYSAHCISSIKR